MPKVEIMLEESHEGENGTMVTHFFGPYLLEVGTKILPRPQVLVKKKKGLFRRKGRHEFPPGVQLVFPNGRMPFAQTKTGFTVTDIKIVGTDHD